MILVKPGQRSNLVRRLAPNARRRPPVCWPFLRLIAKLGPITGTLTLTREYAYPNYFEVKLRALTDLASIYVLGGTTLIVGAINFAWLADWVLSPDWLSRKNDILQALR